MADATPDASAAAASAAPAAPHSPAAAAAAPWVPPTFSLPHSVHRTPLAHILPEFVPESWTVRLNEPLAAAEPQPSQQQQEESKEQPVAAAAAADAAAAAPAAAAGAAPLLHPLSVTVERVSLTPLMLRIPNFLTAAECSEVLRLAYSPEAPVWKPYRNITYKPTLGEDGSVVAQKFEVGYSQSATLFQLDYGHFPGIHPMIAMFADRVARLVNSTKDYSSNMRRLLRYKPGQKFDLHADDYDRIEPLHRGRRNLTCLIYVHTEDDETGGGTVFPLLDGGSYRSPPTSGSMLIFRNFDPANGYKFDPRCQHYAETTTKGNKYAINLYFVEQEGMWWH